MTARRSKPPQIIGINTGGRLGNHLFNFTWMIEMARLTGAVAINPGFSAYKSHFQSTAQQKVAVWPTDAPLGLDTRILLALLNQRTLWLQHHFRISRQWRLDEAKPLLRRFPGVRRNWGFIAFDWLVDGRHADRKLGPTFASQTGEPDLLSERVQTYVRSKHRIIFDSAAILPKIPVESIQAVRDYFSPRRDVEQKARQWLEEVRGKFNAKIVIGVAVRQGDFRTWGGGTDFVDPSLFQNILRGVSEQLPTNRCAFVLCSDESIRSDEFPGINAVSVPHDPPPLMHLCTLKNCDYIIGTAASTFIQWASFLGDVPWHPVAPSSVEVLPRLEHLKTFGL
jgi:hypothetical protein